MAFILALFGLLGYEYYPELTTGLEKEYNEAKEELAGVGKFFAVIGIIFQFLWRTIKTYAYLVWDILSGNAYKLYGAAPYIAILGQLYSLVYILPDDLADVINSPFIILGADKEYLYLFPLVSYLYWFALLSFNIYSGNVDVRIEKQKIK